MIPENAQAWAQGWIDAWNARDLDRVLAHYAPNFEMSSPYIVTIANEPSGILRGKADVAAYWRAALEARPDLHFELRRVFRGAHSLALFYQSHGVGATEVFFFDENGQVARACAHYGEDGVAAYST